MWLGDGDLVLIDNRVTPATGTLRVKAEFTNNPRAGCARSVRRRRAAVAPAARRPGRIAGAIQRGPDGNFVFRVEKAAKIVPVQVLDSDERIAALTRARQASASSPMAQSSPARR